MIRKFKSNLKEEGVIYFANIIFQKILALATITLLTNKIAPEIFGQYIYTLSLVSIFIMISHLGIPILLIRNISSSKYKISKHNSLCSSIVFSLFLSFFIQILIFIHLKVFFNDFISEEILNLVFIYLILTSFYQIFASISVGLSLPVKGIWPEIYLKNLIFFIAVLFYEDLNLIIIFKFLIFLSLISLFIIFVNLINQLSFYFKNFYYFKFEKKIISAIFSLGLASILSSVFTRMDVFMIEYFLDYQQVALYNIAFQIGLIPLFLAISLNVIISPKISEYFSKRSFEKVNIILGSSRLIFFICNIIFLIFYEFLLVKIFALIFPETYDLSLSYSYYFIFYCIFVSLIYFADTSLVMTGNEKIVIYSYIVAIIINFLSNIIFIPIYGIKGALIATILSLIIFNLINFIAFKIIIKKKTSLKIIISSILESLKKNSKILSTYV